MLHTGRVDEDELDEHPWFRAIAELREIIGDVTMSITEIDDSLGELILDLLVLPPVHGFYRQHVLRHQIISRKVELLSSYVKAMPDCVTDADFALDTLTRIAEANRERNRLVHDLHVIDWDDRRVTRRRLWDEQPTTVDMTALRELAGILTILSGPGMEALCDAFMLPMPSTGDGERS